MKTKPSLGPWTKEDLLQDYQFAVLSREASLLGRKEVLSGRAKFGIFGDGKELAQIAMAKVFKAGDWRSGYYRDQTFAFATGISDVEKFFAQLYAHADTSADPASGGRQMNSHFATRYIDNKGEWLDQSSTKNTAADMSPTAGQMPRLLGLAYASKLYREVKELTPYTKSFSRQGNEIAFGTIGDASTSEGLFFESINAACVLGVPLLMSVWDDGYGISVPKKYQTAKESISAALAGFADDNGMKILRVKGWDYPALIAAYQEAETWTRQHHRPVLMHIEELTQPQGHSTSGSHERYKSAERMSFEIEKDCIRHFESWLIENNWASAQELAEIKEKATHTAREAKEKAWDAMIAPIEKERLTALELIEKCQAALPDVVELKELYQNLKRVPTIARRYIASAAKRALIYSSEHNIAAVEELKNFYNQFSTANASRYNSHLYNESTSSTLKIEPIAASYTDKPESIDGSAVIRRCFDALLARDPRVFIIGEDVGHLGGVNTEFEGLQEKHGFWRVTDTGIREATIFGQGLGAAMRGLRPLVDIQYLDYVLYCLQGMSDDLATLRYRTANGQSAPVIVRSKGHRLEGIWHTGSHMGGILHLTRGIYFCVPRNMVQASGMYNTLFAGDDPAFVCEVLNGYRLKEAVPENLDRFRIPLGLPEVLREGSDITVVTYGACCRIVMEASELLSSCGVSIEVIDVQTLNPFDRFGIICHSLKKTQALLCVDEDVPGGASAFMMDCILNRDGGYHLLDAKPLCLTAKEHRGAYASDGDYYSKPNVEDVFDHVMEILSDRN
jgi:2-oxoisovalerate dehydrogenase E1 component